MKTKKLLSLALFLLFILSACSDDEDTYPDVDGLPPTIALENELIQSERGNEIKIKALIEDKDGIRSIRLKNDGLQLDKTIDILTIHGAQVYTYDLDYAFKLESTLPEADFPLVITVTDLGERTTDATLLITTDVDFTAPSFTYSPNGTVTVLDKGDRTGLLLNFGVSDNKALKSLEISIPEINFTAQEDVSGQKTFEYSEKITLDPTVTTYNVKIIAVDLADNDAEVNFIVNVSPLPDFAKMYLVDVKTESEMNDDLFGIPMLIEHTGAYEYKARYYADKNNAEVRFVPQKTGFTPICFGKDPNSNTLTDEPDISQPIVLPNIGYYEITFNTKTGVYNVNPYTPNDTPVEVGQTIYMNDGDPGAGTMEFKLGLAGKGIPLPNTDPGNTWTPWNVVELTQNSSNKFIFSATMELVAGTDVDFTITPHHPWGWWLNPFWRFENGSNDSGENEYNTLEGGNNMTTVKVKKSGKYMFKFDTHLLRSKLYPIE